MNTEKDIFSGWERMDIYEKLMTLQRAGKDHEKRIRKISERLDRIEGKETEYRQTEAEYRQAVRN